MHVVDGRRFGAQFSFDQLVGEKSLQGSLAYFRENLREKLKAK